MAQVGGAQVFFDVLATFNARRLLSDQRTIATMMKAAYLDTLNVLTGEFQAAGQMIDEFTDKVVGVAVAFEEARIDFEKFVNVSEQMEGILPTMVENIVAMGEGFAFTGEEALKAASPMAQMGAVIGRSTIETGTEMGVMFGLISGMETGTAMKRLTNLMQQTGFHMATNLEKTEKLSAAQFNMLSAIEKENMFRKNTIDVLNQLNTVENRSIATMEQLTFTMNQFASQAALTGSSIGEMAAMSAALIEAGEQQGAAGRALRMMYARLGGNIAGARDEMQAMGIAVTDGEGNMKTLTEVMVDLKEKGWADLTAIQQQNIAQSVSGNRHYVRFIKLMENLHRVTDLTSDSLYDFDSAQEEVNRRLGENAVILEGVEAKLQNVNAQIGGHLLPGMIEGKEATLMFNQELEKFASGEYGQTWGDMGNAVVKMRSVVGLVGPFLQMQVIGRGLVVAFEVMRSVVAGIRGETIALNRQYHNTTSLMEISNQKTQAMKDKHELILRLQGQLNENKMFQLKEEELIVASQNESASIQNRLFLTIISENAARKEAFILRQSGVKEEQLLLGIGEKIEGSMKRTLKIMQNKVEMEQRLRQTTAAGLSDQRFARKIMDVPTARAQLRIAIENIKVNTILLTTQKDAATAAQTKLHILQKELNLKGLMTLQDGKMLDIAKHATDEQKKAHELALGELKTKQLAMNTTKQLEYRMRGEAMHLDTIIAKMKAYGQIEKEIAAEKTRINALLDEQKYTSADLLYYEDLYLKQLGKEINMSEMTVKQQKKIGRELLAKILLEEKDLKLLQQKNDAMARLAAKTFTGAQRMESFGHGVSGGLTSLGMMLPMMSQMTGNARLMRASMTAMSLSMVPMVANMAKGAYATAAIALNIGKARDGMKDLIVKQNISKSRWIAMGLVMSGVILVIMDQMQEKAEKANKAVREMTDSISSTFSVLETGQGQEFLSTNEQLAEIYGIQGVKLRDLADDYAYAEKVAATFSYKVEEGGSALERANQGMVDSTKIMLDTIIALHEQSANSIESTFMRMEASAIKARIRAEYGFEERLAATGDLILDPIFNRKSFDDITALRDKLGMEGGKGLMNIFQYGNVSASEMIDAVIENIEAGYQFTGDDLQALEDFWDISGLANQLEELQFIMTVNKEAADKALESIGLVGVGAKETGDGIEGLGEDIKNLTEDIYNFSGAREEVFFGGKYGNVTGSLYKQVVQQGVGTLYHKNEVIMSNNFHGFFNEEESAEKIIDILDRYFAENR